MTTEVRLVSDITIYAFLIWVAIGLIVTMIELAIDGKFLTMCIAEFSDSDKLWIPFLATGIAGVGAWPIVILWNLIGET
jgi:hypothetical protein